MSDRIPQKHYSVKARQHFTADYIDGFRGWLSGSRYTEATITELVRLLACWSDWVHSTGFGLDNISDGFNASIAASKSNWRLKASLNAGALFIRFLRDLGTIPQPVTAASPTEVWPILGAFRVWMHSHRGIADSSLDTYQTILIDLLKALGDDPTIYSAHSVRAFVYERAKQHGSARARSVAVATRTFLRYLVATGQCPAGREYAVPAFANWQLASLPKFISLDDVECLIGTCGKDRPRDRAIILLLARLGLRASEVANLEFGHVDWRHGRIAILGKSRREEWLPLTQEVGDAMVAYIEQARPRFQSSRLFIADRAPIRPVTRTTVKSIVRRALIKAGIDSAHQGAHVLRHSAATAMLRHGVSLAGVGAVLRHRSLSMAMHYSKVDFDLLAEIAQPWAGRSSC